MIKNELARVVYTGDGESTEFSIPFGFSKNEAEAFGKVNQITVFKMTPLVQNSAEVSLAFGPRPYIPRQYWERFYKDFLGKKSVEQKEDTDYEVQGQKVVFFTAPEKDVIITILRDVPHTQEVQYDPAFALPVEETGQALDKLTQIVQQHADELKRAIKTDVSDTEAPNRADDYLTAILAAEAGAIQGTNEAKEQAKADLEEIKKETLQETDKAIAAANKANDTAQQSVEQATQAALAAEGASTQAATAVETLQGYVDKATAAQVAAAVAQNSSEKAQERAENAQAAAESAKAGAEQAKRETSSLQAQAAQNEANSTARAKEAQSSAQSANASASAAKLSAQTATAKATDAQVSANAAKASAAEAKVVLGEVYTRTNLVGGDNVSITEVIPENVIDNHTLACWHFDNSLENVGKDKDFTIDYGSNSPTYIKNGDQKFGEAAIAGSWSRYLGTKRDKSFSELTIDFWIKNATYDWILDGSTGQSPDGLYIQYSSGRIKVESNQSKFNDIQLETGLDDGYWHHFAITFSNFAVCVFVDGSKVGEASRSGSINWPGYDGSGWLGAAMQRGDIDELRVSDIVRYTKDFTPPTEPYASAEGGETKYQINCDGSDFATKEELSLKRDKNELAINEISATAGSYILDANKIYRIMINDAASFSLPSVDTEKNNQIKVFLHIVGTPTIDWGTSLFLTGATPDISDGDYEVYFDFIPGKAEWAVGALKAEEAQ